MDIPLVCDNRKRLLYRLNYLKMGFSSPNEATVLPNYSKHLTYGQRIQMLKLPTLRYREQHADMICVYSLFNSNYNLNYSFFYLSWQYF